MSIFDHQRLTNSTFKLDIERMRQGWYTDKYFVNVAVMLSALSQEGYTLEGRVSRDSCSLKGQRRSTLVTWKWKCSGSPAALAQPWWWGWIKPWQCCAMHRVLGK